MPQILIVGAGPVGLTAAAELAQYGVSVRIIDKSPYPTGTSKALVVWSRTLELMDRMGCTPAFLGAGIRCHVACCRPSDSWARIHLRSKANGPPLLCSDWANLAGPKVAIP